MRGVDWVEGGKAVSWVAVAFVLLRAFQWFCDFLAGRHDARQARLDAYQALVDDKVVARLKKLEVQVSRLERAANILITEIREIDPGNPKLVLVNAILSGAIPLELETPEDMQAALDKLGGA